MNSLQMIDPSNFIVGPDWDRRVINVKIPKDIDEVGLLVSGGMDSAILLYCLLKFNPEKRIKTFCVPRLADDAETHSKNVHKKIRKLLPYSRLDDPELIGEPTDKDSVPATRLLIQSERFKLIYDGLNHQVPLGFNFGLPERHLVAYARGSRPWRLDPEVIGHDKIICPLLPLYKYHIIDMYYKLDAEELILPTHSCTDERVGRCFSHYNTDAHELVNNCMWCCERAWGFEQLNRTDPGTS